MASVQGAERAWSRDARSAPPGSRTRRTRTAWEDDRAPALLATVIEADIIPRLLTAHRDDRLFEVETAPSATVTAADVDELAPLVLSLETIDLLRRVEAVIARGVSIKTVFVDLLAPVARRLGEYWEDDTCDFLDVTMGLWRLQEVVREIAATAPAARRGRERQALFAPVPGEQHSFGAVMVEELFRRSGWTTASVADGRADEILELVGARAFHLVGLTLACESHLDALPDFIGEVRHASRNRQVFVMVGGRVFNDDPELAMRVRADGTAPTASQAVAKADILFEIFQRQSLAAA